MVPVFRCGNDAPSAFPCASPMRGISARGFVGKPPRTWLIVAFLALHASNLVTFSVPKKPKQRPLHLQRQKEGLGAHTPAGKDFTAAMNLPGVKIEPTTQEKKLATLIKTKGRGEQGQWNGVQKILSNYSGYSPLVLNAGMQAAFKCQMYQEGARIFERLKQANAPITLPVYTTAMKLYGKLCREDDVRELWQELVQFDVVNQVNAQACMAACADNGNITFACEVLEHMENKSIEVNEFHFSSAINACANSKEKYKANAAKFLLNATLERGLRPDIVLYSCVLRSLRQSPTQDILDLLENMKAQSVKPNRVFAENFFFIFLQEPWSGSWRNQESIASDLRKLPKTHLKTAKDLMDEFMADSMRLSRSSQMIKAALESLL